jgi:Na+-translocating ferredoxin:NAD+ oxidoreductase RNF subunit RnfB
MNSGPKIRQLAEKTGKGESGTMELILACAMTDEEAGLILDLPAASKDLAAKYGMDEKAVDEKILDLARRGLVVSSRKGIRFPRDPATLHDNMLASNPRYIPSGVTKLWMQLYDEEGWAEEIGSSLAGLGTRVLRTIPVLGSVSNHVELLPHESIEDIILGHADLISVRNCCCRTGAKKCNHPVQVCMQFARRAEYDLYRESGRKVSAEVALAVARTAGDSGLVPTVTNVANVDGLDFICFCCGCCCLVINPGLRIGALDKILAPSRFVAQTNEEACNGCGDCVEQCAVSAIEMREVGGLSEPKAFIVADRCLGCGACVPACPMEGGLTLELVRPPEFVPKELFGPSSILHT